MQLFPALGDSRVLVKQAHVLALSSDLVRLARPRHLTLQRCLALNTRVAENLVKAASKQHTAHHHTWPCILNRDTQVSGPWAISTL